MISSHAITVLILLLACAVVLLSAAIVFISSRIGRINLQLKKLEDLSLPSDTKNTSDSI